MKLNGDINKINLNRLTVCPLKKMSTGLVTGLTSSDLSEVNNTKMHRDRRLKVRL